MAEPDFSSFTDVDWRQQAEEDELNFAKIMASANEPAQQQDEDSLTGPGGLFDMGRPLELGTKADDAEDYEDISDDDLPEEEEASGDKHDDGPGLTDDGMGNDDLYDDDDDLFGDGGRASSPFEFEDQDKQPEVTLAPRVNGELTLPSLEAVPEVDLRALNFPGGYSAEEELDMPTGEEEINQYLAEHWPGYEKEAILNFTTLLPPKKAFFIPKVPAKPPKPLNPTKISLNVAPDQEKLFRTAGPAQSDKRARIAEAEAKGCVAIVDESEEEEDDEDAFNYDPIAADDTVGGLTLLDLEIICADFESCLDVEPPKSVEQPEDEPQDEWEREFLGPSKKRKLEAPDFVFKPLFPMPDFDNFEAMTAQVAKRVVLDLNDPNLLLDIQEYDPAAKRQMLGSGKSKKANNDVASILRERFNYSNDEAYSHLKENHGKVRATVGNISIEHSLPAQKLQWPYYRTKINARDARAYHRPSLKFNRFVNQPIRFSQGDMRKSKDMRVVPPEKAFAETKDLSLSDPYSVATLVEYSEEHPTILSNFGMGNRIINYYRRKNADDKEPPAKPKDHVGDTTVLLPEDRSPFAIFGTVEPGETVRTIHNAMYRAPIFKHEPKSNDFLVVRNSTGVGGTNWYLRNINHLFVAGQQLPSMEVPGPHARRVTNAQKHRMRMIALRKIRHNPRGVVSLPEMTAHIADSTDPMNRSKLKEFMTYDKSDKTWRLKDSEGPVPDESVIRAMVKPEDVCAIDAMEVGKRHLLDAGYTVSKKDDDEDDQNNQSLEQKLAPWRTTKSFVEASQEKAMLELHGAGDPTGCGLGISMIKTSMKGGYLEGIKEGELSTAAAKVALDRKANNGHGYNVKTQQTLYSDGISRIWNAQMVDLSNQAQHDEMDVDVAENESFAAAKTPHSMGTPAFDDDASVYSEDLGQRVLRITRVVQNEYGQEEEVTEVIKDQKVISMYERRRYEEIKKEVNIYKMDYNGDPVHDAWLTRMRQEELARLNKNKLRRKGRENSKKGEKGVKGGISKGGMSKSKGPKSAADSMLSPSSTPAPSIEKSAGTSRKCANCGQAGHIKTNKKLCPKLNGSEAPADVAPNNTGFGPSGFGPSGGGGSGLSV